MNTLKRTLVYFYPFILALAPTLSLYQQNFFEVPFLNVCRSLILLGLLTLIVYALHLVIFRKNKAAARILSVVIVFFLLNFGAILSTIVAGKEGQIIQTWSILLAAGMVLFVLFMVWMTSKRPGFTRNLDLFFGLMAAAFSLILAVGFGVKVFQINAPLSQAQASVTTESQDATFDSLPDIYFIVLDSYTSKEVLQKEFGFDNSEFLSQLIELGFTIPTSAYSNYDATAYSLSSILNMDFVQSFTDPKVYEPGHYTIYDKSIHNQVREILQQFGYKETTFSSDYPWLLWRDADHVLEPQKKSFMTSGINQFEFLVLKKSVINLLIIQKPYLIDDLSFWTGRLGEDKYQKQLFLIENLTKIPDDFAPKFIYAHSTIPHVPYLFRADGSMIAGVDQGSLNADFTQENLKQSYLQTISFVNARIIPQINAILEKNPNSIIILTGDHGYPGEDQNTIFFAIHDPGGHWPQNSCFSLINLFRRILSQHFGLVYPDLPDAVYRTLTQDYYQFEQINACSSNEND